jgi:hypothetical protein
VQLKWNIISVCLEIVQILTQDKCTVGAKSPIATETVLDAPYGTPRFKAQVEAHFSVFRDGADLDAG